MQVIIARNVNDAVAKGARLMKHGAVRQASRAGPTLEYPEPVCTVYEHPMERVLFDAVRDCNPFFHLMESLWMLAGRNDVAWLSRFNKRMESYSDDGEVFNAAYGYRWRQQFNCASGTSDQLTSIAEMLRRDPDSRRAVLQIWDAAADLGANSKDLACNTQAMFKVRDGHLNMTVSNRSNDIIWGCYGANAVHFSFLLEYMAARIGVEPGVYRQMSDSYHAYMETWPKFEQIAERFDRTGDPYDARRSDKVEVYPLVAVPDVFDAELRDWLISDPEKITVEQWQRESNHGHWQNPFFGSVATPMHNAWFAYKAKDVECARRWLDCCAASDWRRAGHEWLDRRMESARAARAA